MNELISKVTTEFAKEYDKRAYKILDGYFGAIPRDLTELSKWFQEKRNQGYNITHGEDLSDIGMASGTQIYFLTIKYDKEIVLKKVIITLDINTIFEKS